MIRIILAIVLTLLVGGALLDLWPEGQWLALICLMVGSAGFGVLFSLGKE